MNTHALKKMLGLLALTAMLPAAATITTFYDFNDGTDLGWTGVTGGNGELHYTSDGGLNDSGAVFRNDTTGRNAYMHTNDIFDGTLGPMTMSLFFEAGLPGRNETAENRASQMGFRTDDVWGNSDGGQNIARLDQSPNSVFVSMFPRSGSEVNLRVGTMDNTGSFSSQIALTEGDWYYWTSTFELTGTNTWDITSEIFAADDEGNIGSSLLTTSATGLVGPTMNNFGTVFGSIGIGENDRNNRDSIRTVDNVTITVVPEPGTLVLVGIALGSLMLFRRRSR